MKILLGVSGSIAARLTKKMVYSLIEKGHDVLVVYTDNAQKLLGRFVPSNLCEQYVDSDVYYKDKNDPILHIDLREWADVFLVCPASANTIAKMANGICDNLLTDIFRAWDFKKQVYIAPAMNCKMWSHPSCKQHIEKLYRWGVKTIYPTVGTLACNEYGIGALANIDTIIDIVTGTKWGNPIPNIIHPFIPFVPLFPHEGAFGALRKYDIHTGIDIYTEENTGVLAMQTGEIVDISIFTGKEVGSPWWNTTHSISVKGASGIICYGEITPANHLKKGDIVTKGDCIGWVKQVLKKQPERHIEGHSMSMLHIELLKKDSILPCCPLNAWTEKNKRPDYLLDPSPYLLAVGNSV